MSGECSTRRGKRLAAAAIVVIAMWVDHCQSEPRHATPPAVVVVHAPPAVASTPVSPSPYSAVPHPTPRRSEAICSLPAVKRRPEDRVAIPGDWGQSYHFRPLLSDGVATRAQFRVARAILQAVQTGKRSRCSSLPPLIVERDGLVTDESPDARPALIDWAEFCRAVLEPDARACDGVSSAGFPDLRRQCHQYFRKRAMSEPDSGNYPEEREFRD